IQQDSSWSCVHGVGRWKENCGCHTGGNAGWTQQWRKPLRDSLDVLREKINKIYEKEGAKLFSDPWKVRNQYISLILNRGEENTESFLNKYLKDQKQKRKALRLLEMQRNELLMYTSCGWFFDEVSGIETTQIMQYACRAIQLAEQEGGVKLEPHFLSDLSEAHSNMPNFNNAAEVYEKYVIPTRLTLERVGMHYAVASIFEEEPDSCGVFNYTTANEFFERKEAGAQKLALGITRIQSKVTRSQKEFKFAVLYLGQQNIIGNISLDMSKELFHEMQLKLTEAFEQGNLGHMFGVMQQYFGPEKYNLWHLFKDEKRKILSQIMERSLNQVENSFRKIYNRDYQLINALKTDEIPIPSAYNATLQYVLNADLRNVFLSNRIDLEELERVISEYHKWNLSVDDKQSLENYASITVYNALERIQSDQHDIGKLDRLLGFFELIETLGLTPNLYKSQNLYFEISLEFDQKETPSDEWKLKFGRLADRLGVKL
ncbi:MAG: DUF3536 domain-containing protein, partial [Bacteroidota bacterium]